MTLTVLPFTFILSVFFLFSPNLFHFFTDNHVDAATKSRTSEDILRSSRLSTFSPEPYAQSESDYYPYTSSPKGRKPCHFTKFTIASCIVSSISTGPNRDAEVQLLF